MMKRPAATHQPMRPAKKVHQVDPVEQMCSTASASVTEVLHEREMLGSAVPHTAAFSDERHIYSEAIAGMIEDALVGMEIDMKQSVSDADAKLPQEDEKQVAHLAELTAAKTSLGESQCNVMLVENVQAEKMHHLSEVEEEVRQAECATSVEESQRSLLLVKKVQAEKMHDISRVEEDVREVECATRVEESQCNLSLVESVQFEKRHDLSKAEEDQEVECATIVTESPCKMSLAGHVQAEHMHDFFSKFKDDAREVECTKPERFLERRAILAKKERLENSQIETQPQMKNRNNSSVSGKSMKLDVSLLHAFPGVLAKAPAAQCSYEKGIIEQLEAALRRNCLPKYKKSAEPVKRTCKPDNGLEQLATFQSTRLTQLRESNWKTGEDTYCSDDLRPSGDHSTLLGEATCSSENEMENVKSQ